MDIITASQIDAITTTADLRDLRDALNAAQASIDAYREEHPDGQPPVITDYLDLTDLPVFDGGYEPADTRGIYSWGPEGALCDDGPQGARWVIQPWGDFCPTDKEVIGWAEQCADHAAVERLIEAFGLDEDQSAIAWDAWLASRPGAVQAADRYLLPRMAGDELVAVEVSSYTGNYFATHSDLSRIDEVQDDYGHTVCEIAAGTPWDGMQDGIKSAADVPENWCPDTLIEYVEIGAEERAMVRRGDYPGYW